MRVEFDFQQFISSVGLPGALCIYVLTRMNKTIEANTKAVYALAAKIGADLNESQA